MSMLRMATLSQALRLIREEFRPLEDFERLATAAACGRVLAQEIRAPEDLPGFPRAIMDGYAVRAADTFGATEGNPARLALVGEVRVGQPPPGPLGSGEAMAIPTGGFLPEGADAVVMVEDTEAPDPKTVLVFSPVAPGESVIGPRDDIAAGTRLFSRGHRLRPQDVGALMGLGLTAVPVVRAPRAAIVATGEEIVPPDARPEPGQVRDINSYTLQCLLADAGAEPLLRGIVPDTAEDLRDALERALEEADLVVISGGSSVGTRDVTLAVLEELGEVLLQGLRMKPGKPTIIARAEGKPVVGCPGHPVSAFVVGAKVIVPIVERLLGVANPPRRPRVPAVLAEGFASAKGRREFVRVRLEGEGDRARAVPIIAESAVISSLALAHGLVEVPEDVEGLEAGTEVWVELW
ncbi:molybdopterin molybdenumtransferase MoeA [Candidatus Acetothermia bacterium]|nr:MAG: molybdopterin molybdenumtransferase MoeA [Candidatus Acetothermia bacterium]